MKDFKGAEPLLDRSISFRPCFMPVTTNEPLGALYLSQAWYWRDKGSRKDGWIYKTWFQFFEETGLSQKQQIRIRKRLCEKSWWEEKVEKVNGVPTFHYRIDRVGLMAELSEIGEKSRNAQREFSENAQREFSENAQREFSENAQREFSLYKESEITNKDYSTEITQDAHAKNTDMPEQPTPAEGDSEQTRSEDTHTPLASAEHSPTLSSDPKNLVQTQDARDDCNTLSNNNSTNIFGKERPIARQKVKAQQQSWVKLGMKNDRWRDLDDCKSFENYAAEWVRTHPELTIGGKDGLCNPKGYLVALMTRTARCVDENSKDLTCWRNWQLEKQAHSLVFNPEPEPEKVASTEIEMSKVNIRAKLDATLASIGRTRIARERAERSRYDKWGNRAE